MPMLPPMLRIRLKMPAALPICSRLSVPMAAVATGTYMDDAPTPLMMIGQSRLAGDGDDRAPHNHPRTEPIELLTFVEHDLEARQPNGEQSEADVIDVCGGRTFQIRRIL